MARKRVVFLRGGGLIPQCTLWDVCNVSHDLLMSMNLDDMLIFNIKVVDYHCIISGISKSEALNLLQSWFTRKKQNILKLINVLYIKTDKKNLTFGDTEIENDKSYHHKSPIFIWRCRYWESISI